MNTIAIQGLVKIMLDLIFIYLTFTALRGVRTEQWLKKGYIHHGQILLIFLSITIGYNVSNFFYDFIISSQNLIFLF